MTYHQPILRVRNLSVDLSSREVLVDNARLQLTQKEYLVLEFLMRHKGSVLTKNAITEYVYGGNTVRDTKIIDIFVWKLRKKLSEAGVAPLIGTAWGRGFIITDRQNDALGVS